MNAGEAGPGAGRSSGVLDGPVIQLPDAAAVKRAVLDRLRRAITVGEMPPGARLLQTQLASALGVSRMPVRDAINDLVAEGLAVPAPGGGASVSSLTTDDMRDVYAVRGALEVFAIRSLATTISEADLERLRAIIARSQTLIAENEREGLTALDKEFHWTLYRATGNRFLATALTPMWAQVDRIMYAILSMEDYGTVAWEEHVTIVDALEARDAEAAAHRMDQHLRRAAERLVREAG